MKRFAALLGLAACLHLGSARPPLAQDSELRGPAGMNDRAFDLAPPPEDELRAGPEPDALTPEPVPPDATGESPPETDEVSPAFEMDDIPAESGAEFASPATDEGRAPMGEDPAAPRPDRMPLDGTQRPLAAPTAPAASNPFFSLSLDALGATRAAPLFTPSRTAPAVDAPVPEVVPQEPEPVEPVAPELPMLQLIGIVVAGTDEVAILSDGNSGEVVRLHPGEEHQGWRLKILDGQSVELSNGGQTQKLTMFTEFPDAPQMPSPENGDPALEDPGFSAEAEPLLDENGQPIDRAVPDR